MTTGERIRSRRIELGMSQDELAQKLGYKSRSSVNKLEIGDCDLKQSQVKAIANALETTTHYIMGWTDDPTPGMRKLSSLHKPEEKTSGIDKVIERRKEQNEEFSKMLSEEVEADQQAITYLNYFIELDPSDRDTILKLMEALVSKYDKGIDDPSKKRNTECIDNIIYVEFKK